MRVRSRAERGGDTAFNFTEALGTSEAAEIISHQSGVAPGWGVSPDTPSPSAPFPAPVNLKPCQFPLWLFKKQQNARTPTAFLPARGNPERRMALT